MLTLGPTFIKLGQLLSTRPDVLPPAYIDVLASLQDDVPPEPWEETKVVLEDEVGPVEEVFDEFDTDSISGASLGQVYVATYEGQEVAVKVRRPGVEELVEADLQAIRWLLPVILYFIDENRAFSMRNVADEFDKTIREEMDYAREADMLRRIRSNFTETDQVVIPGVVEELSTGRVLTMEYVEGTKITRVRELDRLGVDRERLARTLQRVYLQMMIIDGVFHADPHPGNLAVRDDGAIIFYDFGMSGEVAPFIQDGILEFYIAVANQDIDAILDAMIEMGALSPEADRGVMRDVMDLAIQDARGEDIEQYRVQQIIDQVEDTIYEFPLRMPRELALVLRVATVVEGVCVTLDEDFDFISVATDYLGEEGYFEETIREAARDVGRQFRDASRSLVRVPPKLESTLDDVRRGEVAVKAKLNDPENLFDRLAKRLVYGILLGVGVLSTSILFAFATPPVVAVVPAVFSLPLVYLLYRSLRGRRGLRTGPQFTRQSMREREEDETQGLAGGGIEPDLSVSENEDETETARDRDRVGRPGGDNGETPESVPSTPPGDGDGRRPVPREPQATESEPVTDGERRPSIENDD